MWEFIEENLPDYSSNDSVLLSDILQRFVDDEEVEQDDIDDIMEGKPRGLEPKIWAHYQLMEIDKDLLKRAIEAKQGINLDF